MLAVMITTTSYGTWLPGDERGSTHRGRRIDARPGLEAHARSLCADAVVFTDSEQDCLFRALVASARSYDYPLEAVAIEPTHVHWLAHPRDDAVHVMVGRLKTAMRQALRRGRIWSRGYDARPCWSERDVAARPEYISRHAGYRPFPPAPGSAGGQSPDILA